MQDTVATSNLVEVDQVWFGYDERRILKDINLVVPKGKVVAIMGLSGCGKTTLLRLIGGALFPNEGEIRVAGRVINALDDENLFALRRKIGMLFQFGALFTDMSSFDNVAFQMREHTKLPESLIRDLVLMKLQAVGLRSAADLMPSELSGGMARRVALARSIALDPMLMLYDEPFTGLDPISLGVIGQLIRRLNDSLGATSIVVTHDVAEALELVDYVYYMSAGKVEFQGTPDEVRAGARRCALSLCEQILPIFRCRFIIRRRNIGRICSHNDSAHRRAPARARRAHREQLGLASGIRVPLPVGHAQGVGGELSSLPSYDSRNLLHRGAVAHHHPRVGAVRRDGSGTAGLRHARAFRFLGGARSACEPVAGA